MRSSRRLLYIAVLLILVACTTATNSQTQIVFDGNSLTAGVGASQGNSYPEQVQRLLPHRYTAVNVAVSAQTTRQMMADAAGQVDRLIQPDDRNILVAWEGTNDLYFGASSDEAYTRLRQYCRDRRAAGFLVIILTILPRAVPGIPADFETSRQAVNRQIRLSWPEFADALVDVATLPHLGQAGDELDPRYYADTIHLTDEGYALVARAVAKAIEDLQRGSRSQPSVR
jgi:lysophospholipase L1-like esterase